MSKDTFGHKLHIGGTPGKYHVSLDDHELLYVTKVELEIGVHGPATATVTLYAGEISVDGDVKLALRALCPEEAH